MLNVRRFILWLVFFLATISICFVAYVFEFGIRSGAELGAVFAGVSLLTFMIIFSFAPLVMLIASFSLDMKFVVSKVILILLSFVVVVIYAFLAFYASNLICGN